MNDEISFTIAKVPEYLRSSEFFLSLEDNDEQIILSKQHYKPDVYVRSLSDMHHLLSSMRFWGVKAIPRELVMFVAHNPKLDILPTLAEFTDELKCVAFLKDLRDELQDIQSSFCVNFILQEDFMKCGTMIQRLVNLLKVQFTHQDGQLWNENTTSLAARTGWLDCLMFLHENECAWCSQTCYYSTLYENKDCLTYAHNHGCPWDERTCAAAARIKDDRGCPWDARTCSNAAYSGSMACLKYARERGCPWDAQACSEAAYGGELSILKYRRDSGCPWDDATCSEAARGNKLRCLQYAHENGCPWNQRLWKMLRNGGR